MSRQQRGFGRSTFRVSAPVVAVLAGVGCSPDAQLSTSDVGSTQRDFDGDSGLGVDAPEAADMAPPSSPQDAGAPVLPGQSFAFDLNPAGVYIDLAGPSVVTNVNRQALDWDLYFEGVKAFTNGGAAGPGEGASFGPTSELELLFDTAADVPLRTDLSDGVMMYWYWFGDSGIASRYRIYGVRDAEGRLFKVQVLSYYGDAGNGDESAIYSLRYAEVTEDSNGETMEVIGLDARAGGVTIPPGAAAGCIKLASGQLSSLSKTQWTASLDWDLCFQRTDVFINGGLSGPGGVAVVDLEQQPDAQAPDPLTSEEMTRTADGERARFEALGFAQLSDPALGWDRIYGIRPRIGDNWLYSGTSEPLSASWVVRGADGQQQYILYFSAVQSDSLGQPQRVQMQVKSLLSAR